MVQLLTLSSESISGGTTFVRTANSVLSTGLTHELVGDGVRAILGETGRSVVTAETGVEGRATSDECAARLGVVGVGRRVLFISFETLGLDDLHLQRRQFQLHVHR